MKPVSVLTAHPFFTGGAVWLGLLAEQWTGPLSVEWPLLMVAFAAMVTVPLGLDIAARQGSLRFRLPFIAWAVAWAGLVVAAILPPGWQSGICALPWVLVTFGAAIAALWRLWQDRWTLPMGVMLSGPALLAVGGAWLLADRAGWEPLGFDFLIVRLTAAHFHFAGFALPLCAGLLLLKRGKVPGWLKLAAVGVVSGIPLVAAGITLTRLGAPVEMECTAAILFSLCAGAVGAAQVSLAVCARTQTAIVRGLLAFSGLSLVAGMSLAVLYALRPWCPLPWLHLPRMWAVHGSLQVFGFALPGLAGWRLWESDPN